MSLLLSWCLDLSTVWYFRLQCLGPVPLLLTGHLNTSLWCNHLIIRNLVILRFRGQKREQQPSSVTFSLKTERCRFKLIFHISSLPYPSLSRTFLLVGSPLFREVKFREGRKFRRTGGPPRQGESVETVVLQTLDTEKGWGRVEKSIQFEWFHLCQNRVSEGWRREVF